MGTRTRTPGDLLRNWRQFRRISQLDLALNADVSTRHISFIETGRSQPSRNMLLHLAEQLDIPLRDRNDLLVAAGYAPVYSDVSLDDPARNAAREAIDMVLTGHEPYPAIAIDRHWNLVNANRAIGILLEGIAPEMLEPPVNVLRLSLHPEGLAPRILDPAPWRRHVRSLLRRQIERTADPMLSDLYDEVSGYPVQSFASGEEILNEESTAGGLVIPLRIQSSLGILSFFSTTTIFGAAHDVTLAELAIESFFPADAATSGALIRSSQR